VPYLQEESIYSVGIATLKYTLTIRRAMAYRGEVFTISPFSIAYSTFRLLKYVHHPSIYYNVCV
jgi:hypothetical protein